MEEAKIFPASSADTGKKVLNEALPAEKCEGVGNSTVTAASSALKNVSKIANEDPDKIKTYLAEKLNELRVQAENESTTIKTLKIVVKNVLLHGDDEDPKFRRLRLSNVNLMQRLLQYSHAIDLCKYIGFVHDEAEDALIIERGFERHRIQMLKDMLDSELSTVTTGKNSASYVPNQEETNKRDFATDTNQRQYSDYLATKKPKFDASDQANRAAGSNPPTHLPSDQEVGMSVYCDICNKARLLTKTEEGKLDLSEEAEFHCSMVPRIKDLGGCEVTDDEITLITGEGFGFVLSRAGVHTRAQLAACNAQQFDAGPYAPYLEKWISEAQRFELDDIMKEVFEPENESFLSELFEVGISSPKDIIDHIPSAFVRLFYERVRYDPEITEEKVKLWQERAAKKADEIQWLENYEYAYMIEITEGGLKPGGDAHVPNNNGSSSSGQAANSSSSAAANAYVGPSDPSKANQVEETASQVHMNGHTSSENKS